MNQQRGGVPAGGAAAAQRGGAGAAAGAGAGAGAGALAGLGGAGGGADLEGLMNDPMIQQLRQVSLARRHR